MSNTFNSHSPVHIIMIPPMLDSFTEIYGQVKKDVTAQLKVSNRTKNTTSTTTGDFVAHATFLSLTSVHIIIPPMLDNFTEVYMVKL